MSQYKESSALAGDLPEKSLANDLLNVGSYVETLTDFIASDDATTPMTVGIYGKWGSGKTTLMRMVQSELQTHTASKNFPVVWFDAWKYDREEALWRALILRVLDTVRRLEIEKETAKQKKAREKRFDTIERSLYHAIEVEKPGEVQFNWGKMAQGAGQAVLRMGLSMVPLVGPLLPALLKGDKTPTENELKTLFETIESERYKEHRERMRSLEEFQDAFGTLIKETLRDTGRKLVVFIDDLDRCRPDKSIEVLESIKLFMDVEGCFFVLGLDHGVISRGVEIKYRELGWNDEKRIDLDPEYAMEGRRYLEKIIQVPFEIPPIEGNVMREFVQKLVKDWPDPACAEVFAEGMGESPRQVKRTVNTFLLLWKLVQKQEAEQIRPIRLAKVVALQQAVPAVYDRIKQTPRLLRDLDGYFRALRESAADKTPQPESVRQTPEPPQALQAYVSDPVLKRIMEANLALPDASFESLPLDELRRYFTLTRSIKTTPEIVPESNYQPFEYEPDTVPIAAGEFWMGTTPEQQKKIGHEFKRELPKHKVNTSAYRIGKFPVTNVEYQAFVQETKHREPSHWSGGSFPSDLSDHPVVNVSWDDATAYCAWLRDKTGREVMLPTEAQWEKAARGMEDDRIYPWGDAWDEKKLNTGTGATSTVGSFSPDGDSPFGCVDMAGNVWEWCQDWFDESEYKKRGDSVLTDPTGPDKGRSRVLRGGSFDLNSYHCRCSARNFHYPDYRDLSYGFRIVVLSSPMTDENDGR
ncbi:MAG: SUMF1/EgtB/PvdO family nonheme iron enzyme [Bacteroidota bacterium]